MSVDESGLWSEGDCLWICLLSFDRSLAKKILAYLYFLKIAPPDGYYSVYGGGTRGVVQETRTFVCGCHQINKDCFSQKRTWSHLVQRTGLWHTRLEIVV